VLDRVTIAYRGARYEIGRGRDYFGLWTVDAPRSQPLEWWPETQEGWSSAWARFSTLEEPETITAASGAATRLAGPGSAAPGSALGSSGAGSPQPGAAGPDGADQGPFQQETFHQGTPGPGTARPWAGPAAVAAPVPARLLAAGLLGAGVVAGIIGLFPDYLSGASLASQTDNLVAHVIYLAGWAASAILIALGGSRLRIGALLSAGLSLVTFGFFLADLGTPIAGGAHLAGAGLWLSLIGWLACAAGSAVAFVIRPPASAGTSLAGPASRTGTAGRLFPLGRPRGAAIGPAVLLILAGIGAAAAFAPAWDSFTLRASSGQSQTLTAGNAFAEPGAVIAGNVAVMVALAAVVIAAAMWRPARHGAVLLAGAIIAMAAQAISAVIQVGEPVSPTQFGFSAAQASQLGLTVSAGLTPWFWIYLVLVVALVVSFAWMLFTPQEAYAMTDTGTVPGPRAGHGPDPEYPTWHVAQAAAYEPAGSPVSGLDDEASDSLDFGSEPDEGTARRD